MTWKNLPHLNLLMRRPSPAASLIAQREVNTVAQPAAEPASGIGSCTRVHLGRAAT